MAFSITGGRYAAASVSAVATSTVTVGTTPFVQADFTKQRLVGLWSAASQAITNPGFDSDTSWTKGAGVTISGGVANCSASTSTLSQNVSLVVGRTYVVSISYTMTTGSKLRLSNSMTDGTNQILVTGVLAASGTITTSFVAASNGFFIAADTLAFTGTIDNVTLTDNGQFKGMSWVRRWVSTSQLQLEKPFFDPATGLEVTQAVGDQVLVSKDFAESVVTGLAVSGVSVSITDTCTFGIDGNQMGLCLYDESKNVHATFGVLLSGGLAVLGKLDNYALNQVSSSVNFTSTVTNAVLCNNAAVNLCVYGGRWWNTAGITCYFIGGNTQGTAGNTVILNSVECPNDLLTNSAGGNWARNPTRHQLVNCYTATSATWSIMRRWGNGIQRGGRAKFLNNAVTSVSVFGSDAAGTYAVGADPGDRFVVSDMGNGPALVRTNNTPVVVFNFTNLITTDFRCTTGGPGGSLGINNNGTNTFRFSDTYTGLQAGTVGVILNNAGAVADSVASSGTTWSPSLLRRTCVGATVTVNATGWTYTLKRYGYNHISGAITPSTYDLGSAGSADNVAFGGVVTQLADTAVTLSQSAAAALTSIATLDNLYDAAINWGTANVTQAQYPSLDAYPVESSGTVIDLGACNLIIDGTAASAFAINTGTNTITIKSSALNAGTKFTSLKTTGTVTFANGGSITTPYTDASGTRVTLKDSTGIPLSTRVVVNGTTDLGVVVNTTERYLFVQPTDVVRIYATGYGYKQRLYEITGATASDYVISLMADPHVDTGLSTTIRDQIAAHFAFGVDGSSNVFMSTDADLRSYSPAEVANAFSYYVFLNPTVLAIALMTYGTPGGDLPVDLGDGSLIVKSPLFYGKVADSVTTVNDLGIYIPFFIDVDPAVYTALPSYTSVRKNTSGILLSSALWTKQSADISTADKADIRNGLATQASLQIINRGVQLASNFQPHTEAL